LTPPQRFVPAPAGRTSMGSGGGQGFHAIGRGMPAPRVSPAPAARTLRTAPSYRSAPAFRTAPVSHFAGRGSLGHFGGGHFSGGHMGGGGHFGGARR
jgi:hypothetical protein